jgi:hypothetical protein
VRRRVPQVCRFLRALGAGTRRVCIELVLSAASARTSIPAEAGKRLKHVSQRMPPTVHPCWRKGVCRLGADSFRYRPEQRPWAATTATP